MHSSRRCNICISTYRIAFEASETRCDSQARQWCFALLLDKVVCARVCTPLLFNSRINSRLRTLSSYQKQKKKDVSVLFELITVEMNIFLYSACSTQLYERLSKVRDTLNCVECLVIGPIGCRPQLLFSLCNRP